MSGVVFVLRLDKVPTVVDFGGKGVFFEESFDFLFHCFDCLGGVEKFLLCRTVGVNVHYDSIAFGTAVCEHDAEEG